MNSLIYILINAFIILGMETLPAVLGVHMY